MLVAVVPRLQHIVSWVGVCVRAVSKRGGCAAAGYGLLQYPHAIQLVMLPAHPQNIEDPGILRLAVIPQQSAEESTCVEVEVGVGLFPIGVRFRLREGEGCALTGRLVMLVCRQNVLHRTNDRKCAGPRALIMDAIQRQARGSQRSVR